MKTKVQYLIASLLLALAACSETQACVEENEGLEALFKSQAVFEGPWVWLKTDGQGIAGPYNSDQLQLATQ